MRESPPHTARIEVLSNRYDKALDLFSGKPLVDKDLDEWNEIKILKAVWADRVAEEQKNASAL